MKKETSEQSHLLLDIEEQIENLWNFHPENPDRIDVVEEFDKLQRAAASIEAYIQGNDDGSIAKVKSLNIPLWWNW